MQDLLPADPAFLGPTLELLLHGAEIMHFGNGVHRHEADIVAVHRILRPRIAQPGPDLHMVFLIRVTEEAPSIGRAGRQSR
jgi:hypothetical protein